MPFSDKLKEYRIKMDLTQAELGDKIGASQKTISSWETGRSEPTLREFTKLCEIFDCTLSNLSDTRDKRVGEITIDDVYAKIKSMPLMELKKLDNEICERMELIVEVEETRKAHDDMARRLKEYERRLRELEKR